MEQYWKEAILDHVPHGEEGDLQLNKEDAQTLCDILLHNGFAVCLTGGDFGDKINVHWLYAGSDEDLHWADYGKVVFTNIDYIDDYPQAYNEQIEEES